MTEAVSSDKVTQFSAHNAILLVENALQNCPNSVMTVSELKRALSKQVDSTTIMKILKILENSNKIVIGLKGITWIHNNNQNLKNVIRNGRKL
jgi:hypothetical protein